MSTEVEDLLRHTLVQQSQDVAPRTDPWTGFQGRERVHRRNRRLAMCSALSVVAVAAALVQTGAVGLPDRNRETQTTVRFASDSPLLDAPVRGSLASDQDWQADFLASIKSVMLMPSPPDEPPVTEPVPMPPPSAANDHGVPEADKAHDSDVRSDHPDEGVVTSSGPVESPGVWSAVEPERVSVTPDQLKLLYAGDISPKLRLAAVAASIRQDDGKRMTVVAWFEGAAGASPGDMTQSKYPASETYGAENVLISPPGGDLGGRPEPREMLVLTVADAVVEVAGQPRYLAEGRVEHPWTKLPHQDGAVVIEAKQGTAEGEPATTMRVTVDKLTEMELGLNEMDHGTGTSEYARAELIQAATSNTRGGPVDVKLLAMFLDSLHFESKLVLGDDVDVQVRWYGKFHDWDAALITLQPAGGGVLAYATVGQREGEGGGSFGTSMRLLLPADGADRRPFAWRTPFSESSDTDQLNRVKVVAPAGAERVEITSDGKRIEVALGADGSGEAELLADAEGVVRAFDADGNLMGETPLRATNWKTDGGPPGLPGETPETRVVP